MKPGIRGGAKVVIVSELLVGRLWISTCHLSGEYARVEKLDLGSLRKLVMARQFALHLPC